ncbi:Six-bladed beta-propeller, TolB-like,Major royal jelly protein/protein yellow [Cinara cedri]|uniref:Six-bladed beta-propeller, TolB-like,Major royal jelly protein/protein yellow n=1 Tax=Cinara cedri TaxID=506608 RepID=A0A5E4NL16_9HEMI|nr:Six-bladed beta-propeller, TolB-like,Major royal jelly protein/protein yellow [Cinara cedri]
MSNRVAREKSDISLRINASGFVAVALQILVVTLLKRPAPVAGIGLPVDQLTYVVSGARLEWTDPGDRRRATESGEYVARNVIPTRMAMRHDGIIYLAMPRFRRGVPFTLGAIECDPCTSTIEPPILPYPCAAAHRPRPKLDDNNNNNWTMVNVVDVYVDDSGLLWALDVGKVNLLQQDNAIVVRPPMVFAFDTDTDEIVRAIDLSRATTRASVLQSILVDQSTGAGMFVYVSDAGTGNVIVYNVCCDRSFKVYVPAGQCGRRGMMYMAMARVDVTDEAAGGGPVRQLRLYVTYGMSCNMMYVPVHAMDETTVSLATVITGRKPSKMIVLGTDRGSVIYFRTGDNGDVLSWDVNTPLRAENFRYVLRSQKSRVPFMVTAGLLGYPWYVESNFADFFAGDIGCLGVSTRIRQLQRPVENDDFRPACGAAVPVPCDGRSTNTRGRRGRVLPGRGRQKTNG